MTQQQGAGSQTVEGLYALQQQLEARQEEAARMATDLRHQIEAVNIEIASARVAAAIEREGLLGPLRLWTMRGVDPQSDIRTTSISRIRAMQAWTRSLNAALQWRQGSDPTRCEMEWRYGGERRVTPEEIRDAAEALNNLGRAARGHADIPAPTVNVLPPPHPPALTRVAEAVIQLTSGGWRLLTPTNSVLPLGASKLDCLPLLEKAVAMLGHRDGTEG